MRLAIPVIAMALCRTAAVAQTLALDADLDGDGRAERITLIPDAPDVDLVIEGTGGDRIEVRDFVWTGLLAGTQSSLELAANGSVRVVSRNEGIGRGRWTQVLTIAYRGGDYVIAGCTYDWFDTIDQDDFGSCDVTLLTGAGVRDRGGVWTAFRTDAPVPLVSDWVGRQGFLPECGPD